MAIASFRFPGPDLHLSSEKLVNETNAVIHERAPDHLTAQDIQRIHRPLEQVHQDVIQVSFLIDDVGANEGARPDHALLGQAAAMKAAEIQPDGSNRLEEFAPSRQFASPDRNITAMSFLGEYAVKPSAQAATAGLMRTLDLLLEMLGRMPDQNVIDTVVRKHQAIVQADQACCQSHQEYKDLREARPRKEPEETAHARLHMTNVQKELDKAKALYAKEVRKPEVGEARAAEIVAGFPISVTRRLFVAQVQARTSILLKRSFPYFQDAVNIERVKARMKAQSERDGFILEDLERLGLTPGQAKQELDLMRHDDLHSVHREQLQDHIDTAAERVVHDTKAHLGELNESLSQKAEELARQITQDITAHTTETAERTVTLINAHTDQSVRVAIDTLIQQSNELGSLVREVSDEATRTQANAMNEMIRGAVRDIGENVDISADQVKQKLAGIMKMQVEFASKQVQLCDTIDEHLSAEERRRRRKIGFTIVKGVGKVLAAAIGIPIP
jgi:hypothetical protein